jgi:hypothetical protein
MNSNYAANTSVSNIISTTYAKKGKMLAAYANTPDIIQHTGTVCEKFNAVYF